MTRQHQQHMKAVMAQLQLAQANPVAQAQQVNIQHGFVSARSAFTISDRLAMVHGGRIIAQGDKASFRAVKDPRVSDFIEGRAAVEEDVATLLNA